LIDSLIDSFDPMRDLIACLAGHCDRRGRCSGSPPASAAEGALSLLSDQAQEASARSFRHRLRPHGRVQGPLAAEDCNAAKAAKQPRPLSFAVEVHRNRGDASALVDLCRRWLGSHTSPSGTGRAVPESGAARTLAQHGKRATVFVDSSTALPGQAFDGESKDLGGGSTESGASPSQSQLTL